MSKSRISKKGYIEFLFVIFLITTLLFGVGKIFQLLLRKEKLERTLTVLSISKAHRSPIHSFSPYRQWEVRRSCKKDAASVFPGIANEKLPIAFRTTVATAHCGSNIKLNDQDLSATTFLPGGDLSGATLTKQAIWLEGMLKSGFGSIPLDLLGAREIAQAIGGLSLDLD